jgi:putative oxidoreductase
MTEYGNLLARVCLSVVFLWSGVVKQLDRAGGTAEVAALGLPAPSQLLSLTILCQIGGGLMVLLGFWTRLGTLALLGFTIVSTVLAHRYRNLTGAERQRQITTSLEHLAIVVVFVMVIIDGPGALSLDHALR